MTHLRVTKRATSSSVSCMQFIKPTASSCRARSPKATKASAENNVQSQKYTLARCGQSVLSSATRADVIFVHPLTSSLRRCENPVPSTPLSVHFAKAASVILLQFLREKKGEKRGAKKAKKKQKENAKKRATKETKEVIVGFFFVFVCFCLFSSKSRTHLIASERSSGHATAITRSFVSSTPCTPVKSNWLKDGRVYNVSAASDIRPARRFR